MNYSKLPPVDNSKYLEPEYFPNNFYAAVFRLWETVPLQKIAHAFNTTDDVILKVADDMGLPPQKHTEKWSVRGYITTIRNCWHILPYRELLAVLDWSEEKLASVLKEDDFLDVKLGGFKPFCPDIVPWVLLTSEEKNKADNIKHIMTSRFSNMFEGAEPFDFFPQQMACDLGETAGGLRMVYSYCGLYAGVLDNPIEMSYPDELLNMYRSRGINAIWFPAALYQLVPFPFDESYSAGWQIRIQRLNELTEKAAEYGIKVYLYINEPRCMPLEFFKNHPHLKGRQMGSYAALCTSQPEVMDYLRYAIRTLCESVKNIGGFFTITCSENLTHCKSREEGTECIRCANVPVNKLVSDVICAVSHESRKVNPDIVTIAWSWAWDYFMNEDEFKKCIDDIPAEVIFQSNSEAHKEFTIGGVSGFVQDYSMSVPGPAPHTEKMWKYAQKSGHQVCAKVQLNNSWECSTLPFLPVFDLIREHMINLKNCGVEHLMLSWTLGGYPSVNLKIASDCLCGNDRYMDILAAEYGEYADSVAKAATAFSNAFREFPFHIETLYKAPQNPGPSNLLWRKPTGFTATMTGYCYDDIESWRSIYPEEIYINQLCLLSEKWKQGLEIIKDMPECDFTYMAQGAYNIFRSSCLQAEFTHKRNCGDTNGILQLLAEEEELALNMYSLMQKCNLIGYEAANHYYYNKGMLAEKVINCEFLKEYYKKENDLHA